MRPGVREAGRTGVDREDVRVLVRVDPRQHPAVTHPQVRDRSLPSAAVAEGSGPARRPAERGVGVEQPPKEAGHRLLVEVDVWVLVPDASPLLHQCQEVWHRHGGHRRPD